MAKYFEKWGKSDKRNTFHIITLMKKYKREITEMEKTTTSPTLYRTLSSML